MLFVEQYPLETALIENIISPQTTDKRWENCVYFKIRGSNDEFYAQNRPDGKWVFCRFLGNKVEFIGTFEELITYLTNRFGDRK